ncbi:MAG: hypothetical protein JW832_11860 [Deltaproteobacteria bacterium]|nr:hypothetical protein [Deltaproteobacteria bacterium]
MQARYHVAASIIASAGTYVLSESATMAAVTLFSGIFIDADHLIDYAVMNRPPYSIRRLFDTYYKKKMTHILLILHSWELIGILALIAMASNWEPFSTGLLIGMGHHMLLDQIFNHPYPLGYFLTFRIFSRFSADRCFHRQAVTINNEKQSD